jgi:hypothetical protein
VAIEARKAADGHPPLEHPEPWAPKPADIADDADDELDPR